MKLKWKGGASIWADNNIRTHLSTAPVRKLKKSGTLLIYNPPMRRLFRLSVGLPFSPTFFIVQILSMHDSLGTARS